jgi:hypothetical protein
VLWLRRKRQLHCVSRPQSKSGAAFDVTLVMFIDQKVFAVPVIKHRFLPVDC